MTPAAPGAGGGTVEVTPATLDITDLAPGAVVAHDVTVTNGSGVPVLVTVTRTEEGALFAGDAPLTLATAWTTTGPSCDGAPVVGADERADLALRVALPEDAGNEYQGLAGRSVVTVTATELPGGTCPGPGVVDPDPGPGSPGGPGGGTPDVPGPGGVGGRRRRRAGRAPGRRRPRAHRRAGRLPPAHRGPARLRGRRPAAPPAHHRAPLRGVVVTTPTVPATPTARRRSLAAAAAGTVLVVLAAVAPSTARFEDAGAVAADLATADDAPLLFTGGVEAGDAHSIGWTDDGELYAWGRNREGQLGNGTAEPGDGPGQHHPARVRLPDGRRVVDACAGADATIALTADGGVYTWGGSSDGVGGTWANNTPTPHRVTELDDPADPVVRVEAGAYFYLALTANGRLFSWGVVDNRLGRPVGPGGANEPPQPVTAQALQDRVVVDASAGRFHAAAIADGEVVVWGTAPLGNSAGTLVAGVVGTPVEVVAGRDTTLVRTAEGRVFQTEGTVATEVDAIPPADGIAVSSPALAGSASSSWAWRGLPSGGRALYAWGDNTYGQLGLGTAETSPVATPRMVGVPAGSTPLRVAAGGAHALFESTSGQYAATGRNHLGQLGDGTTDPRNTFALVIPLSRWP